MPDEITLDKEVFKALAGETRISVMKSLRERRKTQSELAKEIGIAAPTVKEHIDILARAGLVREIDDGHKWKYIELTLKGKSILDPPHDKRILVLLGTSLVGVLGAGVLAYSQLQHFAAASAASSFSFVQESAGIALDAMATSAAPVAGATAKASAAIIPPAVEGASALVSPAAADVSQLAIQTIPSLPFFELGIMIVCLLVFGISVGMWIKQSYV